jgi:hypothetical protein
MDIRDTKTKRTIVEIVFYVFVIGLFGVILPIFGGFALSGFQESFFVDVVEISSYLGTFLIYIPLILGALILPIFTIMNMIFIRKGEHPASQDNPGWLRIFTVSYIFNPEDSFLWYIAERLKEKVTVKWSTNIIRVIFISILLFGILGFFMTFNPQLAVSGVPQTAQQISTASDVIFGAGIPSIAENGSLLIILSILSGIVAYLTAKFIKNKEIRKPVFFTTALIFIAPLMGWIWMSFHRVVYGNSEASLLATFIFGWLGATLIILTGIFLFWFFWHLINNLVIKLLEVTPIGSDLAVIIGLIWFGILIVYIALEIFWARKRKKNKETLLTE